MRMSFMTNQIIRKNNIYIYIYGYLINCEYFNNLNGNKYYDRDMYIFIPVRPIHYKKNYYYRRSKSVDNGQNPSLNQHYRRIIDGQKFVSKMLVCKILPTEIMFTDGKIRR